tara:strand:- start:1778 stop:2668 length:891 start_codon:yes stop_codon:yes gene_type:complete
MIKITHFDHISTASENQEREMDLFTNFFGFQVRTEWHSNEGFYGVGFNVPGRDRVGWELLVPDNKDSFLAGFLEKNKGPGIHHVSMQIPNAKQAIEELESLNIQPVITEGEEHHNVYLHPKRGGAGLLFQLFQGDAWNDPDLPEPTFNNKNTVGIKRIHHLAQAVLDEKSVEKRYAKLFGYKSVMRGPRKPSNEFTTNVLETQTKEIHWELISSIHKDSFINRFLNERGEGPHHVTFIVNDWDQAMEACKMHNFAPFEFYENTLNNSKYIECFLHPRDMAGMLVQLVWEEKEGIWI